MLKVVKACCSEGMRDNLRFLFSYFRQKQQRTFSVLRILFSGMFVRNSLRSFAYIKNLNRQPFIDSLGGSSRVEFLQVKLPNKNIGISSTLSATPEIFGRPKIWFDQKKPNWTKKSFVSVAENLYLTPEGQIFDQKLRSVNCLWNRRDYRYLQLLDKVRNGIDLDWANNLAKLKAYDQLLCISQSTSSVYGHFLVELLPRFWLAKKNGYANLPIYTNLDHEVYSEIFSLLGVDKEQLINANLQGAVLAKEVVVPVYHHASECAMPSFGIEVIHEVKKKALLKSKGLKKSSKRIFVCKKDTDNRKINNQVEVENILIDYGFEAVIPSDFSFCEQVELFASAEFVVGEHGSGMFNAVFCNSSAVVIDLFPGCVNTGLYRVLHSLGITYKAMLSPENSFVAWKNNRSFSINIPLFKDMLQKTGFEAQNNS